MSYPDPDPKSSYRRRRDMIERQLRRRGIWDERVLQCFDKVKRHEFVSEALYGRAYDDHPLPIGSSQTISQPYIVALMTQELRLNGSERVLEIGTGSGFQTAILAELAESVVSVERIPELHDKAWRRLIVDMGYGNIRLICENGLDIMPEQKRCYDRILVTAGAPAPPLHLMSLLSERGIMVIPIGNRRLQYLYRITYAPESLRRKGFSADGEARPDNPDYFFRRIAGCRFVPLIGPGGW